MSLPELLIAVAIVGVFTSLSFNASGTALAEQKVLTAVRQLELGIQQARDQAMRQKAPCALALGHDGWHDPEQTNIPTCDQAVGPLLAGDRVTGLQLSHNINRLQFTSNGLVLGGGTVVLALNGLAHQRCVVISLPLGIVRRGYWQDGRCLPMKRH